MLRRHTPKNFIKLSENRFPIVTEVTFRCDAGPCTLLGVPVELEPG